MSEPNEHPVAPDAAGAADDSLLGRLEVIEAQPLEQRAAGFDQLAEELLAELQRSDREDAEQRDPH